MNVAVLIGSYATLVAVSLYLLIGIRFQYLLYSTVLVLCFGSILGSLFRILHLPGADQLLLIGISGTLLGAVLLIWGAIRNRQGQVLFYKVCAGAILLFQILAVFVWPEFSARIGLLNYALTGVIGTVLINGQYEHDGERNVLILFLLQGIFYIVIDVLEQLG